MRGRRERIAHSGREEGSTAGHAGDRAVRRGAALVRLRAGAGGARVVVARRVRVDVACARSLPGAHQPRRGAGGHARCDAAVVGAARRAGDAAASRAPAVGSARGGLGDVWAPGRTGHIFKEVLAIFKVMRSVAPCQVASAVNCDSTRFSGKPGISQ